MKFHQQRMELAHAKKEVEIGEITGINVEPKKADMQSVKTKDEEIPVKEGVASTVFKGTDTGQAPRLCIWLSDK